MFSANSIKDGNHLNLNSHICFIFRSSIIGDTISDELITSHTKDLLYIQQLKDTTLTCEACERRHVIDEVVRQYMEFQISLG